MSDLLTPFRKHYEHSRSLDLEEQIEECVDYVQHPEVLITEFLESYYLVERKLDPESQEALDEKEEEEFVLEPFHDDLQLDIRGADGRVERISCAGGAFDPLPDEQHPALRRRGFDYVGLRDDFSRIVLGATQAQAEETPYLLLLRALNCFAEVAPPFQLARLRRLVLHDRIQSEVIFDLQIGLSHRIESPVETTLWQLTWDLAEAIKRRILQHTQFEGTLGWIECLFLDSDAEEPHPISRLEWRV
jgi:hypothetical protein